MNITVPTDWLKKTDSKKLMYMAFVMAFFCLPLGSSPTVLFCVAGACVWLFSGGAFHIRKIYINNWCTPIFFYIFLIWAGMLYTPDPWGQGYSFLRKSHYWIFGFAIAAIPFKFFSPEKLIYAFLAGLFINFLAALAQMANIIPVDPNGYYGLSSGYTLLAAFLIVAIMMTTRMIVKAQKTKHKWMFTLLTCIYFFHLSILNSRTGYVAFVLLLPFIVTNFFKRIDILKTGLAFFTCLIIAGIMLMSPVVRSRVELSVQQVQYHLNADKKEAWGNEYNVHQDRFYMWNKAFYIFRDNTFFGVGTGGYQKALKERSKPGVPEIAHPHNNLLHMAVSYGSLGIIAFVWLFGRMIVNGWRYRDTTTGYFIFSTAMVIMATGLFNTQLLNAGPAHILALAAGLQQSLPQYQTEDKTESEQKI